VKFTPSEISEIAKDLVIEDTLQRRDQPYEWLDILGLPQRPEKIDRALLFATHSDGLDGWHNAFDRRQYAPNVARGKNWDLAVDCANQA